MAISNNKPTFVQPVPTIALYFASQGTASDGEISHTIAYLPSQAMTPPITMSESWDKGGCYVFLGMPVWDLSSFVSTLQGLLQQPEYSDVRCIWIENPNDVGTNWRLSTLKLVNQSGNTAQIKEINLHFRNLALIAGQGSIFSVNLAENQFELKNPATGEAQICLTNTLAQNPQTVGAIAAPVKLPFYGQIGAGSLLFDLTLNQADLEALDVGLRFFVDAPTTGAETASLTSLFYPIFNLEQGSLTLSPHLDPCHLFDGAKTYFSLTDGINIPTLTSYYLTPLGHPLTLTPQGDAKLIFALKPTTTTPNPADPLYLVPQGEFKISVPKGSNSSRADQVMCGLSGLEYLGLPPAEVPTMLRFVPAQNAYASGFSGTNALPLSRLSDVATTSWVYLLAETITYYAQPDGAALYQKGESKDFLRFMPIPSGILPLFDSDTEAIPHAFPMVPYGGLSESLEDYRRFELQILSLERRARIDAINQALSPVSVTQPQPSRPKLMMAVKATSRSPLLATPVTAPTPSSQGTTPQGFLATFSQDLQSWEKLTIAQDLGQNKLTFSNIANPLKAALQTNQQFLVISNPDVLANHFTASKVTVAGWNFDLDPSQWSTHTTILIFKFYAGKSVRELVGDRHLWAKPEDFNQDPATTQQTIQSLLNQARCKYDPSQCNPPKSGVVGDSNYEHFVKEVVENPQWNGILALNCRVPVTGLPQELEGLAAGIDASQFYAHHLGIDITPVRRVPTGALEMGASSFFGLIDYENLTPVTATATYDYQVDSLGVLLKNSQVKTLSSILRLSINELFQSPATLKTPDSVTNDWLTLHGSYESHNGHPVYTFVGTDDRVFSMTSSILETVEITKVEFATIIPKLGLQAGETVHSRFILQGNLAFKSQTADNFDLLSYRRLPFANLALNMSFDPQAAQGSKTFDLDESQVTLNASGSEARDNSLAQQFPLKPTGFILGAEQKPKDLGYLSVKTPELFKGLSNTWYGITFELNFGTMGALAPKESFTATLLVAWSPEDSPDLGSSGGNSSYPIAMAIKLPFTGGKKELSLQGILKLAIGAIALSKPEDAYILTFKKIALKLFILSLPPNGSTDMYLFGNPNAKNPTLAWYAAYQKDQKTANQNAPNKLTN
ncbi:MAG: hypothetical protein O9287_09910 [Microcystis sp. LE17-20D]|jgi:hypothetical protein|nr:hypothetical protein [Microcystis sp. LE17-20D]MCZ8066247.1 hypothetical protein [Microcystis sp. LE17-20D]MCZ8160355.1 hypothetical protein [Microcystis sp. LE19-196.1B]MCZ8272697.1 hypothetical protein [Microcystis sp. LE19-4.1E]